MWWRLYLDRNTLRPFQLIFNCKWYETTLENQVLYSKASWHILLTEILRKKNWIVQILLLVSNDFGSSHFPYFMAYLDTSGMVEFLVEVVPAIVISTITLVWIQIKYGKVNFSNHEDSSTQPTLPQKVSLLNYEVNIFPHHIFFKFKFLVLYRIHPNTPC